MQAYILMHTPTYMPHLHTTRQSPPPPAPTPPELHYFHRAYVKASPATMTMHGQSQIPDLGTKSQSARFGTLRPLVCVFVGLCVAITTRKSPRREVVRSSAGADTVPPPPFWCRSRSIPQGMILDV